MKPIYTYLLKLSIIMISFQLTSSYAQNTFPGTGNVGIGTTTPYVWFGPTPILHMTGDRPTIRMSPTSANGYTTLQFRGVTGYSTPNDAGAAGGSEWHMNFQDGNPSKFSFYSYQLSSSIPVFTMIGNGNTGIGVFAPTEKLVVQGNISTSGFIMPAGAANGKVLTSNASGVASWQTITGFSQWTTSGNNISYTNGNVGIGTPTPGEKLVVNGNISATGFIMPPGGAYGKVLTSNTGGIAYWDYPAWSVSGTNIFYNGSVKLPYAYYYDYGCLKLGGNLFNQEDGMRIYAVDPSVNNGGSFIQVKTTSSVSGLVFSVDNSSGVTERMRIQANGDIIVSSNIGIGTSTPKSYLDIYTPDNGAFRLRNANTSALVAVANVISAYGVYNSKVNDVIIGSTVDYTNASTGDLLLYSAGRGKSIKFFTVDGNGWETIKMEINHIGQVAIYNPYSGSGITRKASGNYQLSVDGEVWAQKVVVSNSFADYVFDPDYKLQDLDKVEQYIKENKRLPNIPSALEIKEKGMDMGDIIRLQMEKIEELTLYTIQLKKEIDILKNK